MPAGGATYFPRSPGYSLTRAVEACQAGSNNHPAPPSPPPAALGLLRSALGQGGEVEREGEGSETAEATPDGDAPRGLRVVPKQGRVIMFW